MSVTMVIGRTGHAPIAGQIPLSMPSAPSRMAASKLASVFSGNAAEACEDGSMGCAMATAARCAHSAVSPAIYSIRVSGSMTSQG